MKPWRDVTAILGSLALAGTLVLLSPGVQVVQADDAATPSESESSAAAGDGPTCEVGTVRNAQEIVEYLRHIQRLQLERMAASPDAAAGGDFIVLNNRGYNYGPAGMALPGAIELESR